MSNSKSIAFFLDTLKPGGAQRVVVTLANHMSRRGHTVEVVLMAATGDFISELDTRVKVVDLGINRALRAVRPLAGYLRRRKPAVLYSTLTYLNVVAVFSRWLARAGCRLVVREATNPWAEGKRRSGFRRWIMPYLLRLSYGWADEVVAVSEGVRQIIKANTSLPHSRVNTIYNPLDLDETAEKSRSPLPGHADLFENHAVILAVGRLSAAKDYGTLIEAFKVLRSNIDAKLVILGEGEERESLQALVEMSGLNDHVFLPGFEPNPFPYMKHCQVYALSSAWEGFPNVLAQALACGCEVVSTDCDFGPREILNNGEYGRLVAVGNYKELAAALFDAMAAPRDRAGLHHHLQRFDVSAVVDAYLKLGGVNEVGGG